MTHYRPYLLVILLTVLLCYGCVESKREEARSNAAEHKSDFTLRPATSLIIDIDTLTSFTSNYLAYYEDKTSQKQLLAYLNNTNNEIQFYDIKAKKLEFRVAFDEKSNISQLDGFHIISLDSILVASEAKIYFHLSNRKGQSLKTYKAEPKDGLYSFSTIENFTRLGLLSDKRFVYHRAPYYPPRKKGFWSFPITFAKHLETGKLDTLFKYEGTRADDEFTGGFLPYSFEQNEKEEFVYSFFMDNYIYLTNFQQKSKAYYAGSKYFENIPSMASVPNDTKKEKIFFRENFSYRQIIYDKFRKVYYRFVLHPTKPDEPDYLHGKPFSVIILDEKLAIIGETKVFKEKMYYSNYFVAPEGLYISQNHIENPEVNEDKLNFRLFELIKNE